MLKRKLDYESLFSRLPAELSGHMWTIAPSLIKPKVELPPAISWENWFYDSKVGHVGIHGKYHQVKGSKTLAIVIHGLGGTPDSHYILQASDELIRMGVSTLRLGLRGSGGVGNDLYYAGTFDDILETVSHPLFKTYETIYLIGYSLGGHIALHSATKTLPQRVKGVISICAPIDLAAGSKYIESKEKWPYRLYLLREMAKMYEYLPDDRRTELSPTEAKQIRSIKSWDEVITAKRWGYQTSDEYYRTVSVAYHLDKIKTPSLLLYTAYDPMVVRETIEPHVKRTNKNVRFHRIEQGGHVYLPTTIDLGENDVPKLLFSQAFRQLEKMALDR